MFINLFAVAAVAAPGGDTELHITWAAVAIIAGAIILLVLGIAGFLVKILLNSQASDLKQTRSEIKELSVKLDVIRDSFNNYKSEWESRKEALLEIFNDGCDRNQLSCRGLVEEKLRSVNHNIGLACSKIGRIERLRDDRWERQDKLNARFENCASVVEQGVRVSRNPFPKLIDE